MERKKYNFLFKNYTYTLIKVGDGAFKDRRKKAYTIAYFEKETFLTLIVTS